MSPANSPTAGADDPDAPPVDGPAELFRRAWGGTNAGLDKLLAEAGAPSFPGAAALVPEQALGVAVIAPGEGLTFYDVAFRAAFPDADEQGDLRKLLARARREGSALGLLEAAGGAAVAAWAVTGGKAPTWARSDAALKALERPGAVLVLTFAPSRSSELTSAAVAAFGLTPVEARLAEAFLSAPTLEIAAEQIGVGRETARDAMRRIMAKTHSRRSGDVVRRLTELMCAVRGQVPLSAALMTDAFGLTRSEAEVALQLVAGATQKEAAEALGFKLETVRSYAKTVLAKTGTARVKELARLAAEAQTLSQFADVTEPVFVTDATPARLRLLLRPGGRRVAFLDYGPRSARPAIIFHGFVAGRSLPPALVRALQNRGLRPIVPQRPGFGLTSPAEAGYLDEASDDLSALVRDLGLKDITLFARDGGTAAALAFARVHAGEIRRATLLNPRSPLGLAGRQRTGPVARLAGLLFAQPQLIAGVGEFIRRRTHSGFLERVLRETLRTMPQDLASLDDPLVLAQLVRDIQAQFAHSCAGFVAEHTLYAEGWMPPAVRAGGPWAIVRSGAFSREPPPQPPWLSLPGASFTDLADAGVLAQFTHAEPLADIIAG